MSENRHPSHLYWAKEAFFLKYNIYENGQLVGFIKDSSTTRSVQASIFGRKYIFESEGIFKPRINIIDLDQKEEAGGIIFYLFRYKADIFLSGSKYQWKFMNSMYTKWHLINHKEEELVYADKRKEGYCTVTSDEHALLLLASLIIRNHFVKQSGT